MLEVAGDLRWAPAKFENPEGSIFLVPGNLEIYTNVDVCITLATNMPF